MSGSTLFYTGLLALAAFEALKVYLIMPMPGSQGFHSIDLAYFLHLGRWFVRLAAAAAVMAGAREAFRRPRPWLKGIALVATAGIVFLFNFRMSADQMFKVPSNLRFAARAENRVDESSIVIGIERNGEARAYPVRFLVYHHQVPDTVGGAPVLVTYCSVCRSGRVFDPRIEGKAESFRLVGMDRFNALLEDRTTGSWWRQATGAAVTGPRKGTRLAEVPYRQVTLEQWFGMHPGSLVMQLDEAARTQVDAAGKYERGLSTGSLTRTDPGSWQDKSWVLGVEAGGDAKAYDWNRLKRERVINDEVGGRPIVIALSLDGASYAAFERPPGSEAFRVEGDTLVGGGRIYDFDGKEVGGPGAPLRPVSAHQEFWHSWREFRPDTAIDR